ncbi:MAG: outer membrane lipoprotein-sorting protein [Lentisphaerae bacterium]|nr:outer membrane lipoprotein-sorting protein [Lentisphaerota bacterium]
MKKCGVLAVLFMTGVAMGLAQSAVAPAVAPGAMAGTPGAMADKPAVAEAMVGKPDAGLADERILEAADLARTDAAGVSYTLTVEKVGKKIVLDLKARGPDFLAVFTQPRDLAGEKILRKEGKMWWGKENERPVGASPQTKIGSFGSAVYGDMGPQGWGVYYTAKRLADEGGNHVFELTAKPGAAYAKVKLTVSKADLVAVKAEYKSADGKPIKTATFEYANKAGGRKFVSVMKSTSSQGTTTLTYSNVVPGELSDDVFNVDNL